MSTKEPETIFLKDYTPSNYRASTIDLSFDLNETATRVHSRMDIKRGDGIPVGSSLVLAGEKIKLLSVSVNGTEVKEDGYSVDDQSLTLKSPPPEATFILEIENEINPKENSALLGLYISNDFFVTQCEPEGFRRITYSFDRPDVMATFRTRIEADKAKYPVLLSNGNCTAAGDLDGGRHFAVWDDPHPKPGYLFALVAGDLAVHEDSFRTSSGRDVALKIFVEQGKQNRCDWAMTSLKRSMTWDEEAFGFEYDLDIFMIVAISAFNGGAMENKGLNIFNDKYILADPETATDLDYENIEGVVAHEYFHNWTGNRITCRDWFQLCLKEGLTVFRDQLFSSDMRSEPVKRIKDVQTLRRAQFAEDAGPLAHAVRPESFIEIDNFFTPTVYEKGAELCRMISVFVGRDGFRKGMALYQQRHDGEAATVEEFVAAMGDANAADLAGFLKWYAQAGTPQVSSETSFNPETKTLDLKLVQETKPTPGQADKLPLAMPLRMGLVGISGKDLPLRLEGEAETDAGVGQTTRVLEFGSAEEHFRFVGVEEDAVPSLFRGFSAPVRIIDDVPEDDSLLLMASDSDPFNRWEAARRYTLKILLDMTDALARGKAPHVPVRFVEATRSILTDESLDPAFRALVLTLPAERDIGLEMELIRVEPIHKARKFLQKSVGTSLRAEFEALYSALTSNEPYSPDAAPAGKRALRNQALAWLTATGLEAVQGLAATQFEMSDNMTDTMAALQVITHHDGEAREACLGAFYQRWKTEPTVIDKWLQLEATSSVPQTFTRVQELTGHEAFSLGNPNRVRALLVAFSYNNPLHFHDASGKAYSFIGDQILALDKVNPATAATLCEAFSSWKRFEPAQSDLMKGELERIAATKSLSTNLFEIANKLLGKTA